MKLNLAQLLSASETIGFNNYFIESGRFEADRKTKTLHVTVANSDYAFDNVLIDISSEDAHIITATDGTKVEMKFYASLTITAELCKRLEGYLDLFNDNDTVSTD